jgi:outer membrane protein TolC
MSKLHPLRVLRVQGHAPDASRSHISKRSTALVAALATGLAGCVLAPRGTLEERARVAAAGEVYARPASERAAPELPPSPSWRDVLRHAFLRNGDLEAAYFAWAAAVQRIDIAAGYPNTNVSFGFEYLFSGENLKGWDRTSLTLGFDPMQNLSFPTKVLAAGRVAYEEARAAGERFAQAKLDLQSRVLDGWLDYALTAETIRLQRAELALERLAARSAAARVETGSGQQDVLDAEIGLRRAADGLASLEALLPRQRAQLNGLIGRAPEAPLPPPPALPDPRPLPASDGELLAAASRTSPDVAALAHEVGSRDGALDLARQQWFPDINPFAGITGSMEQVAGAAITLATMIPQIQAGIREAEQNLRAGEARLRQARGERAAELLASLIALRDAERQRAVLEDRILPLANLAADSAARENSVGEGDLSEVLVAERSLLELRRAIAETRIARERQLAAIERLAGFDVETLGADHRGRLAAPDGFAAADGGAS